MNLLVERQKNNSSGSDADFDQRLEKVMASVDLHHVHLRDFLHQLTQQWQDAEDILQELWRYVLLHFPEDQIESLTLLRVKARQLFIDHYRAGKRRPELVTDQIPETALNAGQEASFSEEEEAGLKARFWREFHGIDLSDEQKEILFLHARYGFTYQEIEQQTGIASSTVGDWVAVGRERIADYLNTHQ